MNYNSHVFKRKSSHLIRGYLTWRDIHSSRLKSQSHSTLWAKQETIHRDQGSGTQPRHMEENSGQLHIDAPENHPGVKGGKTRREEYCTFKTKHIITWQRETFIILCLPRRFQFDEKCFQHIVIYQKYKTCSMCIKHLFTRINILRFKVEWYALCWKKVKTL